MNLKYAADGEALEHALISGDAVIQLAGEPGTPGRQIAANTIDIALAPDGSTPTALLGREAVQLTFPPDATAPARTIKAANLDAKGEPGRGLTRALFSGDVQYRERGGDVNRVARAANLDVTLKPGMSSIEDAKFAHAVRFEEGKMGALAAAARYDLGKGHARADRLGARLYRASCRQRADCRRRRENRRHAGGSEAQGGRQREERAAGPPKKGHGPGEPANDVKMPSMLKQDQPVIVVGERPGLRRHHVEGHLHRRRAALSGRHVDQGRDDRHRQQGRQPQRRPAASRRRPSSIRWGRTRRKSAFTPSRRRTTSRTTTPRGA